MSDKPAIEEIREAQDQEARLNRILEKSKEVDNILLNMAARLRRMLEEKELIDQYIDVENRRLALAHAMHLADIRATHTEKYSEDGIVEAEDIVSDAEKFENFLRG
jgi:hypothetical protein